jgi:hypothetical protein
MTKRFGRLWLLVPAALLLVATAAAPSNRCWARNLPPPAARFIHFYGKSPAVDVSESGRRIEGWERLLYSLILATSAPESGTSTSSS